ncbi:MAG TPA: mechanosensitive ion channel domain-containing protein [Gemmatimonadaceae bacterium]|jgi:small-conductance mechanosensitive channel|nr:mechanosensitive ion channel domain-containing protein [Gemmatimonadaceae bacterium]
MTGMQAQLTAWLFDANIGRLVASVFGLLVIMVLVRAAQRALVSRIDAGDTRYRVRKAVAFGGYVVTFLFLAALFSDKLGGLTVAFGVAGAGIAFALQEVIASIAGWLALTFSNFYQPGDRVQLGGIKGDVIDIGVLRTTLMELGEWVDGDLYNGRIVRVANSFVFKSPVFNYSGDFPFLWDEIRLPVRFGSDRARARAIIQSVADRVVGEYTTTAAAAWVGMVQKYRIENAAVAPIISLVATDNWLQYTLRYVVDYRRRRSVKDALFNGIMDAVDASGGQVQLASATFELVGAPPLSVRTRLDPP